MYTVIVLIIKLTNVGRTIEFVQYMLYILLYMMRPDWRALYQKLNSIIYYYA